MNRAVEIYKSRFSNANGFTFLFVGSFDVAALKKLTEVYLASLPSTPASSSYKDVGLRPVKGVVKKEIYRGAEQKSLISMQFMGEAPFSEAERLKITMLVELMNIKITEKLREDLGGIYSARMSGTLSQDPYGHYAISCSIPCGPENVDKLIKAMWEEINKVKGGPTEADLNKVKETMKNQWKESLKENSYWINKMSQWVELGTKPEDIFILDKRVDAITVKDIQMTASTYLNDKNYVQAVLYPSK
jgi:zinc protease